VQVVRSGSHDHVDHGPARPSELRVVSRGAYIYGLNRVRGKHDCCEIIIFFDIVVESLDQEIVQTVEPVYRYLQ